MSATTDGGKRPGLRAAGLLLLVLAVAVVVRVLALGPFAEVRTPQGDEGYYLGVAKSILDGNGHPGSYRAPLYPAFIALVFRAFGPDWSALQWVQIAVSLLPVAAVFLIVRARFGMLAAALSGLAVALVPSQAHYAHFFWSECLVGALLMAFFLAFDRYDRDERARWLVLTGLLLGLAALARETWALFALPAAGLIAFSGAGPMRSRALRALLFLGCTFAVVLPWTARNHGEHGRFVLVSSNRWYPMAVGNLAGAGDDEARTAELSAPHRKAVERMDELEAEAYWREVALEAIRDGQPAWLFRKLTHNVPQLLSLRSQPIRYLRKGWMPLPDKATGRLLVWYDALAYLALTAAGLLGLWWSPGGRFQWMLALAVVFTFAIHVVANATARFLVPLMPLLVLYAGPLLSGRSERTPRWRRIAGIATAAGFLLVACSTWPAVSKALALFH